MSEQVDINVVASEHHVHPVTSYLAVFGALLVLTLITVGVSYMNLGPASLYVALLVAFVKAALVLGFFMHLKYDTRFHQLIFFSSLIFIVIMFGLTFTDLASRSKVLTEQGNFALAADRSAARQIAELNRAQQAAAEQAEPAGGQQGDPRTGTDQAAPAAEPPDRQGQHDVQQMAPASQASKAKSETDDERAPAAGTAANAPR